MGGKAAPLGDAFLRPPLPGITRDTCAACARTATSSRPSSATASQSSARTSAASALTTSRRSSSRAGCCASSSTASLPWVLGRCCSSCTSLTCRALTYPFPRAQAVTLRVWDALILQGTQAPRFLIEVALAVFAMCHEPLLAARNFGEAVGVLKSIGTYVEDAAELLLLTRTPECSLQHTSIHALRAMYAPEFADTSTEARDGAAAAAAAPPALPTVSEPVPVGPSSDLSGRHQSASRKRSRTEEGGRATEGDSAYPTLSTEVPSAGRAAADAALSPSPRLLRRRAASNALRAGGADSPGSPAAVDIDDVVAPPFARALPRSPSAPVVSNPASPFTASVTARVKQRLGRRLAQSPLAAQVRSPQAGSLVAAVAAAATEAVGDAERGAQSQSATPKGLRPRRIAAPMHLARTSASHDPLTAADVAPRPVPRNADLAAGSDPASLSREAAPAWPAAPAGAALVLSPATPPAGLCSGAGAGGVGASLAASLNASIPASAARRQQLRAAVRSSARKTKGGGGAAGARATDRLLLSPPIGTPLVAGLLPAAARSGAGLADGGGVRPRFVTQYDDYDRDADDPSDGDDLGDAGRRTGNETRGKAHVGPHGSARALRSASAQAAAAAGGPNATSARAVQLLMLSPPRHTPLLVAGGDNGECSFPGNSNSLG